MSELRLYNTLTRTLEPFHPLVEGQVRMYCCGPTVYNFIHIGNLRTFLWGDLLRRYLEWKGYKVTQVMNLTDVEDKIIRSAGEKGMNLTEYTAPYIEAFFEDIDTLRIRRADLYPKATEHIQEMLDLVDELTKRGHTYEAEGSTYFKISTMKDYGKLAQLTIEDSSSAFTRIESDEYEKESARDFVLWKAKKEGEPSWPAAIGDGRPGWHLECSAMSMKYLGEAFDLHTGAVDLIFPHHENEIAQSEGATGKPFVRYWIHGEHLIVEDRKMSKSAGNFFTLRDLLEQGFSPLQIRYALLAVPHRTRMNFMMKSLEDAKSALDRLELFVLRLTELAGDKAGSGGETGRQLADQFLAEFEAAMDDDLNTAAALGALFTLVREGNTAIDAGRVHAVDAEAILEAVRDADVVLDLLEKERASLDEEIEKLIQARNGARTARDFKESDRLRDELLTRGIILEDTATGTRWRRK
ncbi:MAG TPA: cysteine--tRNA ligase [Thermoanaerobaculia bacterium]|nr:cysteine--tRNA ligase [Thermoanaerobaculia bacterium]